MIRTLSDRVAVEILPGMGMIGGLFIPDSTKSSRNQTFARARVRSAGPKVQAALVDRLLVVSEYFGDEVMDDGTSIRIGRERDVIAVIDDKKLIPLGDRLLMTRCPVREKVGEIFLPERQKGQEFYCDVIAVGPDCEVAVGDRVLVPKAHSVEVYFEGSRMLWINESALLLAMG